MISALRSISTPSSTGIGYVCREPWRTRASTPLTGSAAAARVPTPSVASTLATVSESSRMNSRRDAERPQASQSSDVGTVSLGDIEENHARDKCRGPEGDAADGAKAEPVPLARRKGVSAHGVVLQRLAQQRLRPLQQEAVGEQQAHETHLDVEGGRQEEHIAIRREEHKAAQQRDR